jgi:hypothetical protein
VKPPLEVNANEHGLFSFMTPPLKLSAFAAACDPVVPWVFVASHDVSKSSSEFFSVSLPLRADHPPAQRTVRGFSVDLLMTWEEFQAALSELEGDGSAGTGGIRFWQLTRKPTRRYQLDTSNESRSRRSTATRVSFCPSSSRTTTNSE